MSNTFYMVVGHPRCAATPRAEDNLKAFILGSHEQRPKNTIGPMLRPALPDRRPKNLGAPINSSSHEIATGLSLKIVFCTSPATGSMAR